MDIKRTAADLKQVVHIANRLLKRIAHKAGFEDPGEVLEIDHMAGGYRIEMQGGAVDLSPRGTATEVTLWMEGYLEGLERMETFVVRFAAPPGQRAKLQRNARRPARRRMKRNSFMEPDGQGPEDWLIVDTAQGGTVIPYDVVGSMRKSDVLEYTEAFDVKDIYEVEKQRGYGVRLSAPGYMDCTDWEFFATEAEARARMAELQAECDEEDEEY